MVLLLRFLGVLHYLLEIRWFRLLGHDHEDRGQSVVRRRGDVVLDLYRKRVVGLDEARSSIGGSIEVEGSYRELSLIEMSLLKFS